MLRCKNAVCRFSLCLTQEPICWTAITDDENISPNPFFSCFMTLYKCTNKPNNEHLKNANVRQPSTTGPASNNRDFSPVSGYKAPAENGCMQGEIILSFAPINPHSHLLWITKKKNLFYGYTSQQLRYAFVKLERKLEPYVNLNERHLVLIRVLLQMTEIHTSLRIKHTAEKQNKKHLFSQ